MGRIMFLTGKLEIHDTRQGPRPSIPTSKSISQIDLEKPGIDSPS